MKYKTTMSDLLQQVNEQKYEVECDVGYRNIGSRDSIIVVVNARNEEDAEDKAFDMIDKLRDRRKIGPGGGGSVDGEDFEVLGVEKTNQRVGLKYKGRAGP
tara:strand:+ start:313 stop:615 length:303 start_codon:yes stop_codon:yes gene_type:complete